MCAGKPCWAFKGSLALSYKNRAATVDGVTLGAFKSGGTGAASVQIRAKGTNLVVPGLPPVQQPNVTVQLQSSGGACWGSTFALPATRNDTQFKDRAP